MSDRKEFDRDLDEYLSARKKSSLFSGIGSLFSGWSKRSQPEDVDLGPDLKPYEAKEEHVPSHEEEYVAPTESMPRKKGWLAGLFGGGEESDEVVEMPVVTDDDLKEVSRIALQAIKMLPPDQLAEFKQSNEFENLKTILKKHSLIK